MIQHKYEPKTQPVMHIFSLILVMLTPSFPTHDFHIHIEIQARLWIAHISTRIKVELDKTLPREREPELFFVTWKVISLS